MVKFPFCPAKKQIRNRDTDTLYICVPFMFYIINPLNELDIVEVKETC